MATKEQKEGPQSPNVVIPLVTTINTRAIYGDDNLFTDGLDQRKINSIYEPEQNAASGKGTIYLAKRPGVAAFSSSYGITGQAAYLMEVAPAATALTEANHWVFSTSSNDVRVSDTSTTTVIFTSANYIPVYVDKGLVSATDTVLLQARNTSTNVQRAWYSTTIATWTEITDVDFTGLTVKGKMQLMDGYAFALSSTNRIYNSDLNTLGTWGSTSYIIKQMTQDIPVGLVKLNKFLIAFGHHTMEVFHNAGNATGSPLELIPDKSRVGVGIDSVEGASMRNYYAIHNNLLFFIGNNPKGLYVYTGEQIEKVSSTAVDKVLNSSTIYNVSKVVFSGKAAIALTLTVPTTAAQRMLLFFPDWKDWFEWTSDIFQPVTSPRIGHTMLGSGNNGHKLYKISMAADNWQDAGTDYTQTHQFTLPKQGNNIKRMSMCGVVGDTSRSASSLGVAVSDDDGVTWSTARNIDMTSLAKMLHNLGAYRERHIRLTHTGNEGNRLEYFIAKID